MNKAEFVKYSEQKIQEYFIENIDEQSLFKALTMYDSLNKQFNNLFELVEDWFSLQNYIKYKEFSDNYKFIKYLTETDTNTLQKDIFISKELKKEELELIKDVALSAKKLYEDKEKIEKYLEKMAGIRYPTVSAILGPILTFRMINLNKSLKEFASLPASTIQMIGAESALFRHLRYKKKAPKYGFLFSHPTLQAISAKNRGKMARFMANKIAIAAKLDLNNKPVDKSLIEQIEKKKRELMK